MRFLALAAAAVSIGLAVFSRKARLREAAQTPLSYLFSILLILGKTARW